jgi:hypothetical protein
MCSLWLAMLGSERWRGDVWIGLWCKNEMVAHLKLQSCIQNVGCTMRTICLVRGTHLRLLHLLSFSFRYLLISRSVCGVAYLSLNPPPSGSLFWLLENGLRRGPGGG